MSGNTVVTAVTLAIGENWSKIAYFSRSKRCAPTWSSPEQGREKKWWGGLQGRSGEDSHCNIPPAISGFPPQGRLGECLCTACTLRAYGVNRTEIHPKPHLYNRAKQQQKQCTQRGPDHWTVTKHRFDTNANEMHIINRINSLYTLGAR